MNRRCGAGLAAATIVVVLVSAVRGVRASPQDERGIALPDAAKVFEAASLRQNRSARNGGGGIGGHGVSLRGMTVTDMLLMALPIQPAQLVGVPAWFATDRFDIAAKTPASTSDDDAKVMLENLLIDRLSITMHVEMRTLPIYALGRARTDGSLGPNLQVALCEKFTPGVPCAPSASSKTAAPPASVGRGGGGMTMAPGSAAGADTATPSAYGLTMPLLARMLSRVVNRVVVDRTGIDGRFALFVRYARPNSDASGDPAQGAPDLFTALQEQLGLKLEATRGPVDVLVIDSARHPKNDDFEMPGQ